MTVVDLAVVAGGPDGLDDEIIGQSKLAAQTSINPQESPQGRLGWIRFSGTQLTIEIGLGDPTLLRLDQGIHNPGHGINQALIAADHRRSQRLFAEAIFKNHMAFRLIEAGAGCGQLRAV